MPDSSFVPHRLLSDHAFLILDPEQVTQPLWNELPSVPLVPERLIREANSMPRLVEVCELTEQQKARVLRYLLSAKPEEGLAVAALLNSKVNTSSLQRHLIRQLIIQTPSKGQLLFRYYDPRVFRHLLWMATPLQMTTILGPITQWTWCNSQGQWQHAVPPDGPMIARYFRVGELRLERIGLLERTLKMVRKRVPDVTDDVSNKLTRQVDQLLDEGQRYSLEDEKDLRLFVRQALTYHPVVYQHPQLQSRLKAVDKNTSYVVLCRDLSEEDYLHFVRDMTPTRKERT